ncbi:helix-turn-helix domain-containing protein [Pseudochelatococcus sp. G4_1912]|uniref:helix-turn-helix domain-containing protein n=1 Tax=Pseudochelatococcus sp. G4_1912 TaxID=3114288 RepID=UPI0039C64621
MYTNQKQTQDTKELRRIGGRWLKEKRESAGLSQRQLADILGVEYYTFISQIETGHGRIPPDRYESWAGAIGLSLSEFVREILRYYDPVTFCILFGDTSNSTGNSDMASNALGAENLQLQEQVRDLQRLLGKQTMELEQARERLSRLTRAANEKSETTRRASDGEDRFRKNNLETGASIDKAPLYGEADD